MNNTRKNSNNIVVIMGAAGTVHRYVSCVFLFYKRMMFVGLKIRNLPLFTETL